MAGPPPRPNPGVWSQFCSLGHRQGPDRSDVVQVTTSQKGVTNLCVRFGVAGLLPGNHTRFPREVGGRALAPSGSPEHAVHVSRETQWICGRRAEVAVSTCATSWGKRRSARWISLWITLGIKVCPNRWREDCSATISGDGVRCSAPRSGSRQRFDSIHRLLAGSGPHCLWKC